MFQIDEEKSSDIADRTSELRKSAHYYNHLSPRNGPLNWNLASENSPLSVLLLFTSIEMVFCLFYENNNILFLSSKLPYDPLIRIY